MAVIAFGACTSGSPGLIENPQATATVHQIAAAGGATEVATEPEQIALAPTATATQPPSPVATANEEPTAQPTKTPKPTATARPAAPEPDDPSVSQVYERGSGDRPEIALTFDAGADRGNAEQILDVLDQYGIKASFGMTGHWAKEN